MTGFHNGPASRVEKLPLSKLFYPIPVTQSTYLPSKLPVLYPYLPPFANCSKQYFSLSTNSTPFNPQSGPREPQWKPYDLLLFLTLLPLPPRWPYFLLPPSQSGPIWSTLDLSLTFCSRVSMVSGLCGSILALLLALSPPCGTSPRGTPEETRGSPDRVPSTCTSRSRGSLSLRRRRYYFPTHH